MDDKVDDKVSGRDLDAVYFAARGLPEDDRAAYLTRACDGDTVLRTRVEQMLAVADEAEAFVSAPDQSPPWTMEPNSFDADDDIIGQKIGRYTTLERLGEGGCGIVYIAEQTEPVRRRTALKLIKRGMDTKQVVARFEAERQALAMMEHPNIAKVHDGGSTESGRPYFVMELVRGSRITEYCDEAKLGTRERLELFIQVCSAIQHAHQKGIIHRDIKPSNILVTLLDGAPTPKVIDFGIAKAIEGRLTDSTIYTQAYQFIGTPAYMSPEQAEMSGLDIDTRSDIYSLGVVLYELLAGCTPLDGKELMSLGVDAMRKTIREKEPMTPSTKVATLAGDELTTTAQRRSCEPVRLIHQLKGDLDWIVMKCLEKDRARRYESASDLANDLKRYLNHEPVAARPPSTAYRVQKAFRRNQLAFIATGAVALALVAGTVISTWQAIEAIRAKKEESKQRIASQQAEARATAQQKKAEAEKQRAEEQLTRAEWLLYAGKLTLAQNDFEDGTGGLALHHLSECPEKLRGWEWRYLWNRINSKSTITGHVAAVSCLAFFDDGKRIITGSHDRTATIWDIVTAKPLLTFTGHKGDIYCLAVSSDGQRIVTGAGRKVADAEVGEAKVWDAATGSELFELKGHQYPVWGVAFSPDGGRIVTVACDRNYGPGEAKIWDAATGREFLTLAYTQNVRSVAFSPDNRRIATGTIAGELKIWDAATGDDLMTLSGHSFLISGLDFSLDGKRILSSSWDKTARIWDAVTGTELFTLKGHADVVNCAAFSRDGKRAATGSYDKTIKVWDAETGSEIFTLKGHSAYLRNVKFNPDGKCVGSASDDNTARVWEVERGQEIPTLSGHGDGVTSVAFSPDGRRVATASSDGITRVWDMPDGSEVLRLGTNCYSWKIAGLWSVAFSPDNRRIVTGCQDGTATVWDAETGLKLHILQHTNSPLCVAYSQDGKLIATSAGSVFQPNLPGEVIIWDSATAQPRLRLPLAQSGWTVAFSPDSKRIASGSASGSVKVWDAETGQAIFELASPTAGPTFNPARQRLVGVCSLAFSPDGRRLVTGGYSKTAIIWDATSGQELLVLKGHTERVNAVAFSPDGKRLLTTSFDRTARLWETGTGHEVFTFKHNEAVQGAAFSPDGQRIVTGIGGQKAVAKVWYAPPVD